MSVTVGKYDDRIPVLSNVLRRLCTSCCLRAINWAYLALDGLVRDLEIFFFYLRTFLRYDNFDAQEDRGAYGSSAYAYDGATFGTGGMGGGGNGDGVAPQQADL